MTGTQKGTTVTAAIKEQQGLRALNLLGMMGGSTDDVVQAFQEQGASPELLKGLKKFMEFAGKGGEDAKAMLETIANVMERGQSMSLERPLEGGNHNRDLGQDRSGHGGR